MREYHQKYPDKAIIHGLPHTRQHAWAALMAGASLLIGQLPYPEKKDPEQYIAPKQCSEILPLYNFIRNKLSTALPEMGAHDLVEAKGKAWCLADPAQTYLVYTLGSEFFRLDLSAASGRFKAIWIDPRSGKETEAVSGGVQGGSVLTFSTPDKRD